MIAPPSNDEFLQELWRKYKRDQGYGATADRPVNGLETYDYYFDTDLGYQIWWNGSNWVDATGATV